MTKTSHRIRIRAQPDAIYAAIATKPGLQAWFTPDIEGQVAQGETAVFHDKGADDFSWKFVAMEPEVSSRWECLEGPGAAAGTKVLFTLKGEGSTTIVECDHDSLPEGDAAFKTCNTLWGILMGRLKDYSETGKSSPALN